MKQSELTPFQLAVVRNEYEKLCSNDVEYFLGEYSTFEWVLYRAYLPDSCKETTSSDKEIRRDLKEAIFRAMERMLGEALMNYYGHTNGPSDALRVATHVSFWAEQMLLGRDDYYNSTIAECEISGWQQATGTLHEDDLKRIANKLGYAGNLDALTVALDEVYPLPVYAEADEIEIEADIGKGALSYHTEYMSAGDEELWDELPRSSSGYLYYHGIEGVKVVAIRPKSRFKDTVIP